MSEATLVSGDRILMNADVIAQRLREKFRLSRWSYLIMSVLHERGDMTMGAIGTALGMPLSSLTGLADSLEGKGIVIRIRQSDDRRSICLRLTDPGKRLYESARQTVDNQAASLVS
jgi:DNA-binding MarR family transcriptional regulator